ncbi:hypothetical protein GDO86_019722, partial [Hymenochirus boettgeri]
PLQKNPWGTFIGTWEMPKKIPPSKVTLTARSAEASKRLTNWIQNSEKLLSASNGLVPQITGTTSGEITQRQEKQETHQEEPTTQRISPEPRPSSQAGPDRGRKNSPEDQPTNRASSREVEVIQ